MKFILSALALFLTISTFSQKKVLDHSDYDLWNTIQGESISNDGNYIMYSLEKGEKDNFLKIKDAKAAKVFEYDRAENGRFSYNSEYALFTIKAWKDSIVEMKRRKVKKDEMPKDTLGIFNLKDKSLTKIANIKSYKAPQKWSGYVAYMLDEVKEKKKDKEKDTEKKDSTAKKEKKPKIKKIGKDNGYHVVLMNLATKQQDTFKYVTDYSFADKGKYLTYATTGENDSIGSSVFVLDIASNQLTQIYQSKKAKYHQLNFSETGKNLAFVVDTDTTKVQVRPNELYHWAVGDKTAKKLVDNTTAPKGYRVSSDGRISFSKDDSKLFFGLAKPPIVKDTTLIDEEIVNVEVWTYDEPELYTVQELQLKNDEKKSFQTVIHLNNNKLVQIATKEYPDASLGKEGDSDYALVNTSLPYDLERQWTGNTARDLAIVNVNTGETNNILTKVSGYTRLSPDSNYAYGYSLTDSTWFAYNIPTSKYMALTKGKVFYNELNDSPDYPNAYGSAGWTKDDGSLLVYDRYDIWEFNPNTGANTRLTDGRENKIVYRYVKLDDEERSLDTNKKWLFRTFNETTKNSGYFEYNPKTKKGKQLLDGPYDYSYPKMAQQSDKVIFTRQSFKEFPDIRYSDLSFKKQTVITNANPQQKDYNWGSIELVNWVSLDGIQLTGMLVKPENFDPNKKYPMLVNFYERSSDDLHNYRVPSPGRSSINYSFYASRGYVIFNPDVHYRIGYPGESALNCVIPGITSLIEKGFVDKDNIGVQGHSWGGYQVAYLVTKTDIFKAAEAGAPVPNMISAYGGIRWWTGLSRQFQYEHTQSRIGGTPWEYPSRYIENSPIFNIDKINTPLLIMHNDADGHVPWYQGIEFFTSLRRLGKPSWFLNYNEEPHWPLKMQNRKDFNIRLAQFFDYYLKGQPKPVWMHRGVPAIEKGINQGYELMETDK
ncbi:MAG: S9 family peptidase [Flavobacteriaceae bacterium]|nr:S9 family peptidase [Flavobacteriaceae bacterium]